MRSAIKYMYQISHLFDTLITISTPHIGISEKEGSYINKGISLVSGAKKLLAIKELYLEDNDDIRNTFIYNLTEDDGISFFKNVLLFHSSYDVFCPSNSSRIQSNSTFK